MRKLLGISALLWIATAACFAQKDSLPGESPRSASAPGESLLIGPGDLIQVDVLDTPEMEQQVRVTDAGAAPLAYIGNVHVLGDTPSAAAAAIQSALIARNVMRHPQVTVRVQEYATEDVSLMGQVKTPGTYAITTPQNILKVLSLAGGLTDTADRRITIKHPGIAKPTEYYLANDANEALADLATVYPGDTVYVPHAPVVYILGDVGRPGGYSITTNDSRLSMMQAITAAGSANKTATQSHVRLIRREPDGTTKEILVHLDTIEKGREPDIALQGNDVVYVPFSWAKNVAMSGGQIAASAAGAAMYVIP